MEKINAASLVVTRKTKMKPMTLNLRLVLTDKTRTYAEEDLTEETLTRSDIEELFIEGTKQNKQMVSTNGRLLKS